MVNKSREILTDKCQTCSSLPELIDDPHFARAVVALRQSANSVQTASGRISELVDGLKSFSQLDGPDKGLVDVNEGLQTVLMLMEHQIPAGVEIKRELLEVPDVMGWPAQLHQLFLVLFRHAMESIGEAGTIFITSRLAARQIEITFRNSEKNYSPAELESLFNPGFSVTAQAVRMDWGMIAAQGIAERHGGSLRAINQEKNGTSVILKLPVSPTL
ncbi:MAG: HAMP domain-containing histidine kinase [bacterium]|nr:HAMP domain-containing histidine kinase [bacterium]